MNADKPLKPPKLLPTSKPPLRLPRWLATKGPAPYWLVEHWALVLAVVTGLGALLNTLLLSGLEGAVAAEWVSTGLAVCAAVGLYLKDRQTAIADVAAWRAAVRAEEAGQGS